MTIAWHEQNQTDVPRENSWLSPYELTRLAAMRFAKRRDDWRLGRWTAKWGVARCLRLPGTRATYQRLEIRSTPSGAPEVFFANQPAAVTISLSHRSGMAVCAAAPGSHPPLAMGCDLEQVEAHSDLFLADYFTDQEQVQVRSAASHDRRLLLTVLWSAKESLLKALRLGLRADTRTERQPRALATRGWG